MPYDRIGVIGAMDSELAALIAALTQPAQETVQGLVFRTGRLGAREVVLVRCGIGKVSAARCTHRRKREYPAEAARGEDHRFRLDLHPAFALRVKAVSAAHSAVLRYQAQGMERGADADIFVLLHDGTTAANTETG